LQYKNALFISALSGRGIDELKASIRSILEKSFVQIKLFIPMSNINLIPEIFACARVISKDDQSDGVLLKVEGFSENINKYSRFIVK